MSETRIEGIRACVFDAYGTLFDYASAAARCKDVLGDKFGQLTALWRQKQLEYTWLRGLQGRHADFWQVTGDSLDFAMETLGLADTSLRQRLMNLYLTLDAFPEAPETLRRLKAMGFKTAILSNGAPRMLESASASAKISHLLDTLLSVEQAGVYKPHPKVYQLAVDWLGAERGTILFVSSNGWDAWAGSAFGMRAVWCNRDGRRRERLPGKPDREVRSLAELPALLGVREEGPGPC